MNDDLLDLFFKNLLPTHIITIVSSGVCKNFYCNKNTILKIIEYVSIHYTNKNLCTLENKNIIQYVTRHVSKYL